VLPLEITDLVLHGCEVAMRCDEGQKPEVRFAQRFTYGSVRERSHTKSSAAALWPLVPEAELPAPPACPRRTSVRSPRGPRRNALRGACPPPPPPTAAPPAPPLFVPPRAPADRAGGGGPPPPPSATAALRARAAHALWFLYLFYLHNIYTVIYTCTYGIYLYIICVCVYDLISFIKMYYIMCI